MTAPYDGDRDAGAQVPPASPPPDQPQQPQQAQQRRQQSAQDLHLQDTYAQEPHRRRHAAPDPLTQALYNPAARPAPGRPSWTEQQPPIPEPPIPEPPISEPVVPSRRLPHGDREPAGAMGMDEASNRAADDPPQHAFAHLYRDPRSPEQQARSVPDYPDILDAPAPPERPAPVAGGAAPCQASATTPAAAPEDHRFGGRASGILKSSAVMAAGTLVSRATGFLRTLVIAAAIGLATLGDTYAVANTLPTMLYILLGGGALNAVFIPQLVRAMKDDEDGGTAYANRLLTLVMVGLAGIVTVAVLGAPLLIRMMSSEIAADPAKLGVAVTFARYCLPTIFFMGVHVVMGQILNARGRFGAMMWTPVLNNIVVIFTFGLFIWVYGTYSETNVSAVTIAPEGVRLLGIGTLLGLAVQALAMIPYLRDAGFTFRPRFDWRGHGLGKAAGLAKWTFLFVLANQMGLIVVTQLATAAGQTADKLGFGGTGIAAYNNALLIWQLPQAIITVSVMTAVLPRISRAAADNDPGAVRDDLSYGLRTSAVAIVPAAFTFVALGVPMCTLLYSSAGESSARSTGFMLMAFGLGLIPYSLQYVVLRGFYAYEDTRTPFYNTVIVAAANAFLSVACYVVLPARWAVVGMAGAYGVAYVIGVGVAVRRLRHRLGGDLDGSRVVRTYARLVGASLPAAVAAGAVAYGVTAVFGSGMLGSLLAVCSGLVVMLGLFFVVGKRMRIGEMNAIVGMVRGKLGR